MGSVGWCARGLEGRLDVIGIVALASVLVTGCALHLHNPGDAKQATSVIEAYGKIDLDDVVGTARKNSTAISRAERESVEKLHELVVRRDVVGIIVGDPKNDPDVPQGWFRLEREARAVLEPLGLLDPAVLAPAVDAVGKAKVERILRRVELRQFAETDRVKLESMVRTYRGGATPGTLGVACTHPWDPSKKEEILTPAVARTATKPAVEPDRKWRQYVTFLVPACEYVRASAAEADLVSIIAKHPDYADLEKQLRESSDRVRQNAVTSRQLEDAFVAARKDLAKAPEALAESKVVKKRDEAAPDVAKLQKEVKTGIESMTKAFDAAQSVPFAGTLVKGDVLREILGNFQALSGAGNAPAHKVTTELVKLLKKYPDVASQIGASTRPPVNVLLLEVAIHRLEYERYARALETERDRLAILQTRRDLMIERMAAWVEVVDAAKDVRVLEVLRTQPFMSVYASASGTEQGQLKEVLVRYGAARLRYDTPDALLQFEDDERFRALAFSLSDVSLAAWRDFIRAPIQEIATYHEGGLRSEDIANIIRAIGLGGIAVGTNR